MLLFYQVATRLSLTTCQQVVELQDDNKLLEQLVASLLSSTTFKPLTTCQQAGNKQCEHILLTSCWNSIATSLLQVCYNLCVFTCDRDINLRYTNLLTTVSTIFSPYYWHNRYRLPTSNSIAKYLSSLFNPLTHNEFKLYNNLDMFTYLTMVFN
jgi:hypothetical protein